jgi:Aspartyl/Asparaginyl beta-hydroxylase
MVSLEFMRAIWNCSATIIKSKIMYTNPRKTTSIRRLGRVDIAALKAAIMDLSEDVWNLENRDKPNRFEALDATRHIVFRFVENFSDWRSHYGRPLWDEWRGLLESIMTAATADYGYTNGEFPRVMLARMPAGGSIQPHRDANPAARWPHKIHVPIQTNDGVIFFVDGVEYRMEEGEAVELNNMGIHAVENRGDCDRIHLIFEYFDADQEDPDWVQALRASA